MFLRFIPALGVNMSAETGRFVWFDLMTTDLEKAKSFYSDVIGWQTRKWPGGDYEMWMAGEQSIGGLMALPTEARKAGTPPHWMGYVATNDVDATVKKAEKLGGRVLVPAQDIPDVGRFAFLADPQGAAFAVFMSKSGGAPSSLDHFSWCELNSTDWKAGWKFYSELFGWKHTSSMEMGPELGEYFMFGLDPKRPMGGMSNTASMMKVPAHWLHYIKVKNADETVKKVNQKGGKVLNGPMDVPGGGRIAQCMDPQGAAFAIHSGQ
jgi:uncharacterized protein